MMAGKNEIEEMVELSDRLEIPFITLSHYDIPSQIFKLIPERTCRNYKAVPLAQIGPAITVAIANPLNVLALDELRSLTNLEVHPVVSTPSDIMKVLDLYSGEVLEDIGKVAERDATQEIKIRTGEKKEETDVQQLTQLVESAPIVNTVNKLITNALDINASDIHIEPFEDSLRIRYRIDGMLREEEQLKKDAQEGIIARVKIMSRLDITQRRLTQDGRFSVKHKNRDIDFRVSVLPTNFGEKIVLRILDKGSISLDLESLGFSAYALNIYKKAIGFPFGMLLITGPTGSGKSTTLYSMLTRLNTLDKNIVTIEDPIEYHLSGISQIQIKPEIGLNFASCLRSVLRQSPDILMVGEIRDTETADIAMKAALTGHLVLSTLHTNDAPSSIPRLMDMGIEPFLIAGSIVMASAQRLCRRLCPHCKEKYQLTKEQVYSKINLGITEDEREFYKAAGCQKCNKTGYQGRVAVVEGFLVNDTIKQMILNRAASVEIKKYAQEKQGMKTLREDGFEKALAGEVSLEEVIRVTAEF